MQFFTFARVSEHTGGVIRTIRTSYTSLFEKKDVKSIVSKLPRHTKPQFKQRRKTVRFPNHNCYLER